MRRYVVLLMVVGLVAGFFAPTVDAKKKKKKKPVPVDLTYHVVWDGETCAISTTADLANAEEACADPFAGLTAPALGHGPWAMAALDGLPITFDAAKPIKGTISAESFYLVGVGPDIMGIGQAELAVSLVGTSGGEEVVIGEIVSDPYTVTPASAEYVVEFEIEPAAELQGKVFDTLTLNLELTGNQMFHGVLPADGTSTITFGAFAIPK